MTQDNPVLADFLKHIEHHEMLIEQDNGVFRCIHFKRPKTMAFSFRIVTWPGHLAVSGDMGDYIFARLEDMFEFFRREDLGINYGYWQEKLKAVSRFGSADGGGWEEYDGKATADCIKRSRFEEAENPEEAEEILKAIEDAHGAQEFFSICSENDIQDAFDYLCHKPTFHIVWVMLAVVWGIQKYDAATTESKDGN